MYNTSIPIYPQKQAIYNTIGALNPPWDSQMRPVPYTCMPPMVFAGFNAPIPPKKGKKTRHARFISPLPMYLRRNHGNSINSNSPNSPSDSPSNPQPINPEIGTINSINIQEPTPTKFSTKIVSHSVEPTTPNFFENSESNHQINVNTNICDNTQLRNLIDFSIPNSFSMENFSNKYRVPGAFDIAPRGKMHGISFDQKSKTVILI
ncbi:hypothetical protein TRFO_17530 [Tritrichomonas foetus]|uniref:Uncharacterized protein n=1 Tax=Tritrichomonas foetus TaxID=1144522 RepID=A0A1J4KMG7_9EUKA|nr:hypothetical protein TRFO_17530 [Tritrichomonas foetus]|eukprot:OHT12503.1 hypothetical protein TRFO_17530 [Tritrichomonas foetus]